MKVSVLKKKISERVKRSVEPFKGTIGSFRNRPFNSSDDMKVEVEEEGETLEDAPELEKKLRERMLNTKEPFKGTMIHREIK